MLKAYSNQKKFIFAPQTLAVLKGATTIFFLPNLLNSLRSDTRRFDKNKMVVAPLDLGCKFFGGILGGAF
ncbi:MAG: hypothetical protein LBR56_03270 [Sporomusaceae bacterium]|nr:hypothetical protein [Sporomusaceae bacterium]